ncbi:MAG: tetratricopeptide repeat protein [Myxococcales bacterium]|nr:tetratricopeptide repeat protein [Myxococcales bacterium]
MRHLAVYVALSTCALAAPCALGCASRVPPTIVRETPAGPAATPYVSPYQYEHYLRGEIALASGQPAAAARYFAEARAGSADDAFLRSRHAQALIEAGEWERADRVLDDSLARFPGAVELWLARARWAEAQGRSDEALHTLAQGDDELPGSAALCLAQGRLLTRLGRATEAAAVLRACGDENAEADVLAAQLLLALEGGDLDQASRVLEEWPEGVPRDGAQVARVAELALEAHRPDLAVRLLELVTLTPHARVLRVRALAAAGRNVEAEAELALLRDADVGGLDARAALYLTVRRPDIALELLGAVVARPAEATPHQMLLVGMCLARVGRAAEGAGWLARVPAGATDGRVARSELVAALRLAGLPALADEVAARTNAHPPAEPP